MINMKHKYLYKWGAKVAYEDGGIVHVMHGLFQLQCIDFINNRYKMTCFSYLSMSMLSFHLPVTYGYCVFSRAVVNNIAL